MAGDAVKASLASIAVVGFGYRQAATLASLTEVLSQVESLYGRADRLAAPRSLWPLVHELGCKRNITVIAVDDEALPSVVTITASPYSVQARGTGSVAEATALLGAGNEANLLGPRLISADRSATAAMAKGCLKGECA